MHLGVTCHRASPDWAIYLGAELPIFSGFRSLGFRLKRTGLRLHWARSNFPSRPVFHFLSSSQAACADAQSDLSQNVVGFGSTFGSQIAVLAVGEKWRLWLIY